MIRELSPELANQIAAGEVVERPVSVVKELVENSLDAGATQIRIDIERSGLESISIGDNGKGILQDDFPLLTKKHSTSKIQNLQDLQQVMTFGFRGEALASISSVCDFEIVSRYESSSIGKRLFFVDGEKKFENTPFEQGTKITVKHLFAKTPARLNYLKTEKTEYNHILEFVQSISLFYPEVSFSLFSDAKQVFFSPKNQVSERLKMMYGEDFFYQLLPLDFEIYGVRVTGFISDPKIHFSNKNRQLLSVNKRLIKSPLLYRALQDAYNRFIPHGTFPSYILSMELDPTQVDANVHPRKLEIRFAHEQDMYRALYNGIIGRLEGVDLLSSSGEKQSQEPQKTSTPSYHTGSGTKFHAYSPYTQKLTNPSQGAIDFTKALLGASSFGQETSSFDFGEETKLIGQVWNSYILIEQGSKLSILDQHALAERVLYEKLLKSQQKDSVQSLLLAETLHITPNEKSIVELYQDIFLEMGFDIEILGSNALLVNTIPSFIKKESISEILLSIIGDIQAGNIEKNHSLEEVRNRIYAYTACRSAIKFGHSLTRFEMEALLSDAQLNYSSTCPHGRPVIFEIERDELKGKFDR